MERVVASRVRLLVGGVAAALLAVAARLGWLQVVRAEALSARAVEQHEQEVVVPAIRGTILDREGRDLALSLETKSLFAHAHRVRQPERAAHLLAPILGVSESEILSRLRSGKKFVYLERFLEPDQAAAVRRLDLPLGDSEPFGFHPSFKRYYPQDPLAVHVIGVAGVDGVGLEGAERTFDRQLSGDPARYHVLVDGNRVRLQQDLVAPPKKAAGDVVLCLDIVLQHTVERELDAAMEATGALAASGVLLDPATGEVLALANRPAQRAKQFGRAPASARTNRALVDQYEPGSTFKVVTMASALENGVVRPEQRVDCSGGTYLTQGRAIHDSAPHGVLTAREVLEKSSNIGMVKIVRPLERHALWETISRFGFGRRTGIELPGEAAGYLRPVEAWSGFSQASLAFGHEIGVTVLQMASALATVANDGVRVPPRLLCGTRDAGCRFSPAPHPAGERVIGSRTARELTAMLEGVVTRGTGTSARLPGYRLAGKTGTAQKNVDQGYSNNSYMASFGGFGPLASPRLVCLVVIDAPRGSRYYGGQVAAPVFRRIMDDALRYLGVPPDELVPPPEPRTPAAPAAPRRAPDLASAQGGVPDVLGLGLRQALARLAPTGCHPAIAGRGVVVEQRPAAGSPLNPGTPCALRLGEATEEPPLAERQENPEKPALLATRLQAPRAERGGRR